MWYKKNNDISNAYIQCTDRYDDGFAEMDDGLFEEGFDTCLYLKTFLENPDEDYLQRKKVWEAQNTINECRKYLNDTDYVVTKLNELRLDDGDGYQKALEQYRDVLAKRKECRTRINETEETQ